MTPAERHGHYLMRQLAPDLRASGYPETAKDVSRCGSLMFNKRKDPAFAGWLKNILVPDLKASGRRSTAADLLRCARSIDKPKRRR